MTKILQIVIRFSVVLLAVCFFTVSASAQLEFSNFIVGKNTIMHIEPDGTANLVTNNGISGDDYHYSFFQLLSDNSGNPIAKTGIKNYKYENGLSTEGSEVCTLNYLNNEPIFENEAGIWTPAPFMLKSPDNKYSYILHSLFTYDYKFDSENDLILRIGKTQIRCYCKDNLDNTDRGQDFVVHEYTRSESFKNVIPGGTAGGQDPNIEFPLLLGMSHTDGKSIWVITYSNYEDSLLACKLEGSTILQKIKSKLYSEDNLFYSGRASTLGYNISDNGKIYYKIPNKPKTLCLSFDQDKGLLSDSRYLDLKVTSQWSEISSTGKYLYHTHTISSNPRKNELVRMKISDIENGIYNQEVVAPAQQGGNEIYSTLRIGIDGNIYVHNNKSIMVVYDSETDNPRFETLYTDTDIPDPDIHFTNYLYTYDLFACNSDCDRNAVFSFPDPRNEIIAYEWDFGDGFKSTEITPTHQYAASGNYTVTLEVTLKNGSRKILPTRKIIIFDQKPSATFDNAQVCDGEQLKITLTGTAPYQIFYTFNGENKFITTSDNEYLMNNISGRYQITKVTDQFCEYEPNQNNAAEILPKLNKLTITTNDD